ncbi:MAG: hypothetical protein QOH49_5211 [Acidobacteriota bacterium]|jgi:hypothetical protein|nr:hypothetical protein [Acidobacteriota bacterium]
MGLWTVALLVFLLNLPFGYWRASVRKHSGQWFLAVLLPVPLVIALIIFLGLGWKLITFPVLVGAFFLGQFVGGRVRNIIQGRGPGRAMH